MLYLGGCICLKLWFHFKVYPQRLFYTLKKCEVASSAVEGGEMREVILQASYEEYTKFQEEMKPQGRQHGNALVVSRKNPEVKDVWSKRSKSVRTLKTSKKNGSVHELLFQHTGRF